MKSRVSMVILLATTTVCVVLSACLFLENRALRVALKTAERVMPASAEPRVPISREMAVDLPAPLQNPVGSIAPESLPKIPDRLSRFGRMMGDPEFQVAMMERSKSRIEQVYAGLFRVLDLDEETIEIFKTLLAERSLIECQVAFQRRASQSDPGAVQEAEFLLAENLERIDQSLAEVLGKEKNAAFDYFQETLSQRQSVDELARRLTYSGTLLTEDRAEILVGVMAAAEESRPYTRDLSELSSRDRSTLSEEEIALYLDERRMLNEVILSEASEILEPDQMEALVEQQIREVEQIERQVEFGFGPRRGMGARPGG